MSSSAIIPEKRSFENGHIARTPDIVGGRARVSGTRIRVQDVYVWHERQGQSPDEIVSHFPQLTLGDVYAALAYYWDNRDEIESEMREEDELVEEMKKRSPSKLQAKLAELRGNEIPPRRER